MPAAIAHGAIGDLARDAGKRAARYIRHASVFEVAWVMQAPTMIASAFSSTRFNSGMPVISTSTSGCTSRRFSIGPSDWRRRES